jgi:hypothetical protein
MASYTIELRKVIDLYGREEVESWFKDYEISDYLTDKQANLIKEAGVWSKDRLARDIVDHYYFREIGFETPAMFKHFAKVYMREIMERKLPVIYTTSFDYNPLTNIDYTETINRNLSTESDYESTSNNNASGLAVNSDTPQGEINKTQILQGKYASSTGASETTSEVTDGGSSGSSSEETTTKTVKGNMGIVSTYQNLIKQYRQIIVGVNEEIIKEVNKLFMGLY